MCVCVWMSSPCHHGKWALNNDTHSHTHYRKSCNLAGGSCLSVHEREVVEWIGSCADEWVGRHSEEWASVRMRAWKWVRVCEESQEFVIRKSINKHQSIKCKYKSSCQIISNWLDMYNRYIKLN